MNILYILGNGFDIAQGMKTSYPDFYQHLRNNNNNNSKLLQQVLEDINENKTLWSDMEIALGKFTSKIKNPNDFENLYFELSEKLQNYLKTEDNKFNPSEELKSKFRSDFISPTKYMAEPDKKLYLDFEKKVNAIHNINVINLNYTNTLEKLLYPKPITNNDVIISNNHIKPIIHIHGKLDDTIIIGVDNKNQIANEQFSNNEDIKDLLVKEQSNLAMKNTYHQTCEEFIKQAHLIIIYGVSFGETDIRWWKLIGEQIKNRFYLSIILYPYMPTAIPKTKKQMLGKIEREKRNWLMDKMMIKKEDCPKDINDRIFIIPTYSNAFKL